MKNKEKMYKAIDQHGQRLNNIFKTNMDNVALCKKLFRLENKTWKLATDYCNGLVQCDEWDKQTDKILANVAEILGTDKANIHINGDPRGYALKFNIDFTNQHIKNMYRDFGGYGIIAPDFRLENVEVA